MANFIIPKLSVQLPVSSGAPHIPESEIIRTKYIEREAWAHWNFKTSNATLTDVVNGNVLTKLGTAETYDSQSVMINSGVGQALQSALMEDTTNHASTEVCVYKSSAIGATVQVIMGTIGASTGAAPGQKGGGIFTSSSLFQHNHRGNTGVTQSTGIAAVGATWYFVAISRDYSANRVLIKINNNAVFNTTMTGTYAPQTVGGIALGSANLTTSTAATFNISEAAFFDYAKGSDQLDDLYLRFKASSALKGITI